MTQQEFDARVQEALEKRARARCICLNFDEAEEVYEALMFARTQCQKAYARCEKAGLTSFSAQYHCRIEFMDKLLTRLEKKLKR